MIDKIRQEVWDYFRSELAPMIRKGASVEAIENKIQNAFITKFTCIVKAYGDSIRVSVNLKSNGIIYFVAETIEGKVDYEFSQPSYNWRIK